MQGDIKDYRQPMVTSIGIILGFLLNFLASWGIRTGKPIEDATDAVVLGSIIGAVVLLTITLYRLLNAHFSADTSTYYRTTLRLYILALSVAILGFLLAILF